MLLDQRPVCLSMGLNLRQSAQSADGLPLVAARLLYGYLVPKRSQTGQFHESAAATTPLWLISLVGPAKAVLPLRSAIALQKWRTPARMKHQPCVRIVVFLLLMVRRAGDSADSVRDIPGSGLQGIVSQGRSPWGAFIRGLGAMGSKFLRS